MRPYQPYHYVIPGGLPKPAYRLLRTITKMERRAAKVVLIAGLLALDEKKAEDTPWARQYLNKLLDQAEALCGDSDR